MKALLPYIRIARIDHWGKNVFMLFGCLLAWFLEPVDRGLSLNLEILSAFVLTGLVASSNYVINELLDAEKDRHHPEKKNRPVPSGQVKSTWAVAEWLFLAALGVGGGFFINPAFAFSALGLWLMGCVYNLPPVRTKELPYLDVISESVNNPIRLLLGWFVLVPGRVPPVSLLIAYWMLGAFFMALKRFAEYRHIGNAETAAAYRASFAWYTEDRLLVSCFFYTMLGSLFGGVFIVRYQMELVFFLPFAAAYIAYYFQLGLRPDSPVQHPEKLFREKRLLLATLGCGLLFLICMGMDINELYEWFNVSEPDTSPLWRF